MTTIIDQLPLPVPSRTDPTNFSVRADNFLGELPDFATQINALATELTALGTQVENSKNAAKTSETNAQASAFAAAGSANSAASSSGAALWVSGTTYAAGALVYSPTNGRTYRRKTAGAGTTDPSSDSTNWTPILLEISTLYPAIRPSLNLDFVNNRYLDPRISFSRSSTATYYDGKTTHKAEENLLTYSEQLDNAAWVKLNTTVTANASTNPFGQATADLLVETATTGSHFIYQLFTCVDGTAYTASVYAKYNTRQFLQLAFSTTGFNSTHYANFDVQNGTIGTIGAGATATISSVGNGWYRCSITCTAAASNAGSAIKYSLITASNAAFDQPYAGSTANSTLLAGAQVESRSFCGPYQVTTTKPITNYMSSLVSAAVNSPRFDHDPVTRECLGLLHEDSSTNLLTYSEDLSNAAWTKSNTSLVTTDLGIAPDGTKSAIKVLATATTGNHFVSQATPPTDSVAYTLSVYAKASGYGFLALSAQKSSNSAGVYYTFDLSNGTALLRQNGGGYTAVEGSAVNVGNGWWRCSITFTNTAINTIDSVIIAPSPSATPGTDASYNTASYTGDGYGGIYIWGAQLERLIISPTSYIRTTTTSATRQNDLAYMSGSNFFSWYNQDEGSIMCEFRTQQKPIFGYFNNSIMSFSNTANTNRISIEQNVSGYLKGLVVYASTAQVNLSSVFGYSMNSTYRISFAVKQDDVAISFNSQNQTSNTCNLPKNLDVLYLGAYSPGIGSIRGHLRRFTYYPKRVSNSELQAMTVV